MLSSLGEKFSNKGPRPIGKENRGVQSDQPNQNGVNLGHGMKALPGYGMGAVELKGTMQKNAQGIEVFSIGLCPHSLNCFLLQH